MSIFKPNFYMMCEILSFDFYKAFDIFKNVVLCGTWTDISHLLYRSGINKNMKMCKVLRKSVNNFAFQEIDYKRPKAYFYQRDITSSSFCSHKAKSQSGNFVVSVMFAYFWWYLWIFSLLLRKLNYTSIQKKKN